MAKVVKFILSFALCNFCCADNQQKPNIVIIMADDLGFNDVGFHGSSEIPTPNIDALAYNGVILNRFYTPPLCTPSRSSLMTGKYSTKIGMNHYVIASDEPWGLPLNQKLISNYFKDAGYRTALIGKWHLGFHRKAYTPTMRGFDSHFGYLGPYIGYYDYSLMMHDRNYSRGYDMRRNMSVNYMSEPRPYVTELFTDEAVNLIRDHNNKDPLFLMVNHLAPHAGNEEPDNPLEAPEDEIKKFEYIKDLNRRTLAAMISVMDQGIGKIVTAINDKGIMNNTVILFFSDNGGPTQGIHSTDASNFPLRGQKGSVWEGGCRVAACVYSPLIKSPGRVSNDLMYVTDVLPTLASLANIKLDDKSLDGFDQWDAISTGASGRRNEVLYNIDNVYGFSALSIDGWKLLNGTENIKNAGWLGRSGLEDVSVSFKSYIKDIEECEASRSLPALNMESVKIMREEATVQCSDSKRIVDCNPTVAPCLFNILEDPCEMNNLAFSHPAKVNFFLDRLNKHISDMVPIQRKSFDPDCDPKNFNNTWTWWKEDERTDNDESLSTLVYALCLIAIATFLCLLFVRCNSKSSRLK